MVSMKELADDIGFDDLTPVKVKSASLKNRLEIEGKDMFKHG